MYIKNIYIKNFRNYKEEEIVFSRGINILVGKNGQGKTGILEAIYIMSSGKSFKTSASREIINFDSEFFRIKSEFNSDRSLEIAIDKRGKKILKKNGAKINKFSDLMENFYTILFSPEDLSIVKEDPEKRRKYIDREICQLSISYYNNLVLYKKNLKQRNSYLKQKNIDDMFLDVLDEKIINYGSKIIEKREEFIKKIEPICKKIHYKISENLEELDIVYKKSTAIDEFKENILKNREKDKLTGNTSVGPHRDDISFKINGKDVKKYGSQGQQRSCILSMKFSEIEIIEKEKNIIPVLLLDDVMSELDKKRQKYILSTMEKTQTFITTAQHIPEILEKIDDEIYSIYEVVNGSCRKKTENII